MNRDVYQTIRAKRAWQAPPAPTEGAFEEAIGSRGWNTRGRLSHYDKLGTLQMVTVRLADAMPTSYRHESDALFELKAEREQRTQLEPYLDRGYGACVLRDPRAAAAAEEVMLRSDGRRYTEWNLVKVGLAKLPEEWTFGSANPRWTWSAEESYRGAHPVRRSADILVGENAPTPPRRQECRRSNGRSEVLA